MGNAHQDGVWTSQEGYLIWTWGEGTQEGSPEEVTCSWSNSRRGSPGGEGGEARRRKPLAKASRERRGCRGTEGEVGTAARAVTVPPPRDSRVSSGDGWQDGKWLLPRDVGPEQGPRRVEGGVME